jgi:hypothetical protein
LKLSESDNWALARAEWDLQEIYFEDEPSTCLCSKYPIIEICVLRNRKNGNVAEVGNVCVNKFLGIPSKIIFDGLKRVSKDSSKALNADASHYAFRKGWISEWEHGFLTDTARKRELTGKQLAKRQEINRRVLARMKRGSA